MKLTDIKLNPNNPRFIKDDKFKGLVNSLKDLPVMTELREVIVDENNMIIGGNMRFRAAKEAGWKEIPTKVFTREMAKKNNELTKQNKTYEQYVSEIVIKDNLSGGDWDWDMMTSHYDIDQLLKWGFSEYDLRIGKIDEQKEWTGMPEFTGDLDNRAHKTIVVHFDNEEGVKKFSDIIGQDITENTRYIWYPKHEKRDIKSMAYSSE